MNRRQFQQVVLTVGVVPWAARAAARWPERPLKLVVPFGAGNIVDRLARLLAERLTESLGQTVVVENQPGAGGTLAVDRVARSAADGHTLVLAGDAAITYNVYTPERAHFDPLRDLAPVSQLAITPNVLIVGAQHEARTLSELIALAKARPGQLSYASAGIGTSQHRGGELLARLAGLELIHVPYSQTQNIYADIAGGRVTMQFANVGGALAAVREGRMRALAVSASTRLPEAPEIPTVAEAAGLQGFEAVAWFGLLAPAGTPAPVVEQLHRETVRALQHPAMRDALANTGVQLLGSAPAAFSALIRTELVRWGRIKP